MDFSVNARAVAGLADVLDVRAQDLAHTSSYLEEHSHLMGGAGLINELRQTHQRIMAEVEGFLHRAGHDHVEQYSIAVGWAVHAYSTTDLAANARIDASMPGVVAPSVPDHQADQSLGPEIFSDRQQLHLDTPADFSASYPYRPSWFDLLSPSSIPRDVIWNVTSLLAKLGFLDEPCDPYEAFTQPLCGDWAGLERTSFALTQVWKALLYVSNRVDDSAKTLDRVWTGHAAGNCRSALQRYAQDLHPAMDLVVQIATEYHQVAEAARKQAEALSTAVTVLVDIGASLGVEFGAEVLVNAVVDGERLAQIGRALTEVFGSFKTAIELVHAVIEAKKTDLEALATQLALLTARPFNVDMPDDMLVLPKPAHR